MISSENRDRWVISSARAFASSTQLSRSDTPSRLFAMGAVKPSSFAVCCRSMG